MKDLKKSYKNEFSKIEPTEEQRVKMLKSILNNKRANIYRRLAVVGCSLVILCVFGITNANDIMKSFNSLIINYKEKSDEDGNKYIEFISRYDGVLEVNYDAKLVERESWVESFEKNLRSTYSNYDLELILGVKFLRSRFFDPSYSINILKKDMNSKITYGALYNITNKYSRDEYDKKILEQISLTAQFKTKYYKEGNDFDLKVRNYYSVKNYYIKNLDTTAVLVRLNERGNHYLVIFAHNNVRYNFYYDNYDLSMDEDKILNRIHEVLDSFYY